MTYKVGDILVYKNGVKVKVLAVCEELLALSFSNEFDRFACWYAANELKDLGLTLEAKPWEPEVGILYWYIESTLEVGNIYWRNSLEDKLRRDFLGVFPTKEAAEARIIEIKKLLGKE